MTDEELEARIAFEKDPDKWFREAERKFEERIDIMNAVLAGNMSPSLLTYSDTVILELRTMEMLVEKYAREGKHCVLSDWASLYYN
tara:strand:- start:1054 stop:1311 length:258 start_codon:yes stop_codon:yes gene_type:complete